VFKIAATRIVARSDRRGFARALVGLPLSPGGRYVDVRFAGDSVFRPAWARVFVTVLDSPAVVRTARSLRLPGGRRATFRVVSNGRNVHGTFRFHSRSIKLKAARLTALGIGPRGRVVWLAGRTKRRQAFFAYLRNARHRTTRFQLWIGGTMRNGRGRVLSGRVLVHRIG
jgi:hypothetical protein